MMIEFAAFIQRLNQTKTLSNKLKDALFEGIHRNRFDASETFVSPGNYPGSIYFIQSGMVRGAIEGPQDKVTTWFKQEGDIIVPQGVFQQQPSREYISAITKTTLLSLSMNHLNKIIATYPEAMELLLLLINEKADEGLNRERMLRISGAKERYNYFIERESNVLKRVPHFLIASYLNVTKETFSRLNKGLSY
ncbi:Crp/Fnr family transcriptional regulator [Mucilaginibacter phyllosphaerae]